MSTKKTRGRRAIYLCCEYILFLWTSVCADSLTVHIPHEQLFGPTKKQIYDQIYITLWPYLKSYTTQKDHIQKHMSESWHRSTVHNVCGPALACPKSSPRQSSECLVVILTEVRYTTRKRAIDRIGTNGASGLQCATTIY